MNTKELLKGLKFNNDLMEINTFDQMADNEKEGLEWIPTDFYDLNRVSSGNIFRFMRNDKMVCLAGMQSSGKSLILYNVVKHAQKMGYTPIIFDTEGAFDEDTMINHGIDPSNGIIINVAFIEDLRVAADRIMNQIKKVDPGGKYIFALDSLGNLDSNRDIDQLKDGKAIVDQGLLARQIKRFLKYMSANVVKHKWPFIFTNHLMGSPQDTKYSQPSMIGGYAVRYLAHMIIYVKIYQDKDGAKNTTGMNVSATTMKNRIVPPYQTGKVSLSWDTGIGDKYVGMLELMEESGMAKKNGAYWQLEHYDWKSKYKKVLDKTPEITYSTEVLDKLNEFLITTGYSKIDIDLKDSVELEENGEKEESEKKEDE